MSMYQNQYKLDKECWYEHVPKSVQTSQEGEVIMLWNQVQIGRTVLNSKLDITIHVNKKGTYVVIDVAIYGYRNVIKKEAEKVLKHEDLTV